MKKTSVDGAIAPNLKKIGQTVEMSDRVYVIQEDGSYRRLKPQKLSKKLKRESRILKKKMRNLN